MSDISDIMENIDNDDDDNDISVNECNGSTVQGRKRRRRENTLTSTLNDARLPFPI